MNYSSKGLKVRFVLVALAACVMLAMGVVSAAAAPATAPGEEAISLTFENVFSEIQGTPVYQDACTKTCHANIAKTKNYGDSIIFSHAYHQLIDCSSCHPRFPHRTDAKIDRPDMKICFNCHGLEHGPMGLLAAGKCEKCHLVERNYTTRPKFHLSTPDWAGKGHVAPSNKELNTKCMMCHEASYCVDCHNRTYVSWTPKSWNYDSGEGCQACHGSTGLTKASAEGRKSFNVSGLDKSVHQDTSCQECHKDYNYVDGQATMTNSWQVNVGQACADCHKSQKDKRLKAPVAEYDDSVHAEQIEKGNFQSATCGSCHGGHFIYTTKTATGAARMHASSYRTCARCKQHGDNYTTYNDYYHGKAYKAGAVDAPSCWQCHGAHSVLPSADKQSMLSEDNVGKTCGQEGCHVGTDNKFGTEAAQMIHSTTSVKADNPVIGFFKGLLAK